MRTRAERRFNDTNKAIRKRNICRDIYPDHEWYNNLHQYSKNKIHCSCPMCTMYNKTNHKKFRGKGGRYKKFIVSWGSSYERHGRNWAMPELKRIQSMESDLKDYEKEVG